MNKFSEFLIAKRISSGFKSQLKLAIACGISSATISRLETGEQEPKLETLSILSKHLNSTSLHELIRAAGVEIEGNEENHWKERALKAEDKLKYLNSMLEKIKNITNSLE